MFPVKAPVERLLAQAGNVAVGSFSCGPEDPLFRDSGPSSTYCFVFPRTHVWIHNDGESEFLSGPANATLYNEGQIYRRRKASQRGDRCDWCAVTPDALQDAVAGVGRPTGRGTRRLFPVSRVPTTAATYFAQRQLFDRLARGQVIEPLELEESVLSLLHALCVAPQGARVVRATAAATRRQRDVVMDLKLLLAQSLHRRVELSALAGALGCSVFHLCRVFRCMEGTTIADFHQQLRLRLALERLRADRVPDIAAIALDFGFSSHSHFTDCFRRTFGTTPSQFRIGIGERSARI